MKNCDMTPGQITSWLIHEADMHDAMGPTRSGHIMRAAAALINEHVQKAIVNAGAWHPSNMRRPDKGDWADSLFLLLKGEEFRNPDPGLRDVLIAYTENFGDPSENN